MHVHRFAIWLTMLALVAAASPAFARFERLVDANCSDELNCYYWRPKLGPPRGWHRDEEASKENLANVLIPDGSTYASAKTVIYVRATEKVRVEYDVKSIADFMAKDRDDMTRDWPGTTFGTAPAIKNGDGKTLKTQTFTPIAGAQNHWERRAYDKEGKFYLSFTLSADSKAGLEAGMKDFERLVRAYKAKP